MKDYSATKKKYDKKNPTIRVRTDIQEQLKELGNFGDTYSDIIERLLVSYKKHHKKK